jgi:tetratricopeptide (TPR) repeat protein
MMVSTMIVCAVVSSGTATFLRGEDPSVDLEDLLAKKREEHARMCGTPESYAKNPKHCDDLKDQIMKLEDLIKTESLDSDARIKLFIDHLKSRIEEYEKKCKGSLSNECRAFRRRLKILLNEARKLYVKLGCESMKEPSEVCVQLKKIIEKLEELLPQEKTSRSSPIGPEFEKTILAADWKRIEAMCGPPESLEADPVRRMIKGHACLATNQNNPSLNLFLSVATEDEREEWFHWAWRFERKNPHVPVASYFLGDACARLGLWLEAVEYLQGPADSGMALALDALGAARAGSGDWLEAKKCVEGAIKADPNLADAYAALGTIQHNRELTNKKDEIPSAFGYFKKALDVQGQKKFDLASNGLACALFGAGKWEEARKEYETLSRGLPPQKELPILRDLGSLDSLEALKDLRSARDIASLEDIASLRALIGAGLAGEVYPVKLLALYNLLALNEADLERTKPAPDGKEQFGLSRTELVTRMEKNIGHNMRTIEAINTASALLDPMGIKLDKWRDLTQGNLNRQLGQYRDLTGKSYDKQIFDSNIKGVGSRQPEEYADLGNWPVRTWFGLAYPVVPKNLTQTKR